jgi:hypothetical protein
MMLNWRIAQNANNNTYYEADSPIHPYAWRITAIIRNDRIGYTLDTSDPAVFAEDTRGTIYTTLDNAKEQVEDWNTEILADLDKAKGDRP